MRPITAAMRTLLASRQYRVEGKVEVVNPDGIYQDVTAFLGANWFERAEWGEHVDQPAASGVITLIREDTDLSISLAPAIGGSPANRDAGGNYAPFLKEGRPFRLLAAFTDAGVPAVVGDFIEVMRGRIDTVRQSHDVNAVHLEFRDPGAELLDHELKEKQIWADDDVGMPIEDIIQASLDLVHGAGAFPLYVPVSPETIMQHITIDVGRHLEKLRDLAMTIGWELRYRYDDAGVMRLTLYEPNRPTTVRQMRDSMTDVTGTLLSAHVGEVGAVWTKHPTRAGDAQIANNRLRNSAAAISHHLASGTPSLSQNYRVSVVVRRLTNTAATAGVTGRMDAVVENGYLARYNDSIDSIEIARLDAGVGTILATVAQALPVNTDHELALVMNADRISVQWDGIEVAAVTDATYAGPGRAGIRYGANAGGDATGLHLDDFGVFSVDTFFKKSEYTAIPRIDIGTADVRNYIRTRFTDITTGQFDYRDAIDPVSIAEYGEKFAELTFAAESNINTGDEAQTVSDTALADLSTPFTDHDFETIPFYWPAQLGDVYELEANGIVYDSNQVFGVLGFQHVLQADGGATRFVTKGKVVGSIKEWLRRARPVLGTTEDDAEADPLRIRNFHEKGRTPTEVTYGWTPDERAAEQWLWLYTYDQPVPSVPDPRPTVDSPNPIRLTADTAEYTIPIPVIGKITYGLLVPMWSNWEHGDGEEITLHALDAVPTFSSFKSTIGATPLTRDASFYVLDPAGKGGTLRVWTNHSSPNDADPDIAYEGSVVIGATPFLVDATTDFVRLSDSAIVKLLDEIVVHPGRGKRITIEFINSDGISSSPQSFVLLSAGGPVDDANELIDGIIHDYAPFANGIAPPQIVAVLPGAGAFVGHIVFLTTDEKLYKWDGATWTAVVNAPDLVGQIDTTQIADAAINAQKIADGAVETAKIAVGAVDANRIGALAVTTAKLALAAVTTAILAASAVTSTIIADDAVTTPKILAGAVVTAKIAAGAVTANEIAALTITAGQIAAGTITAAKLAAHTITANEIAALTITAAEIASGTITGGKIAANTITAANIAALTITAAEIAANTITGAKIAALTISAANIVAGTITSAELAANSVIAGKIAAAAVSTTELAANAVTAAKIASHTITAAEIAAATITATEIAASTITAAKLSISTLASIATDAGIIVAGKLQNAGGTQYLDLNASGSGGFLVHPKLSLLANGNATFSGDITLATSGNSIIFKDGANTISQLISYTNLLGYGIQWSVYNAAGVGFAALSWQYNTSLAQGHFSIGGRLDVDELWIGGIKINVGAQFTSFSYNSREIYGTN